MKLLSVAEVIAVVSASARFVPVQVKAPHTSPSHREIHLDIQRSKTHIHKYWPMASVDACVQLLDGRQK
jgi:hypothetical protein